jgi:hypothetical protein
VQPRVLASHLPTVQPGFQKGFQSFEEAELPLKSATIQTCRNRVFSYIKKPPTSERSLWVAVAIRSLGAKFNPTKPIIKELDQSINLAFYATQGFNVVYIFTKTAV